MLITLVVGQSLSAQSILKQAQDRIARATTITVAVTQVVEEFPKPVKTKWWFRKGGYYRSESPMGTLIASPAKCWSYQPRGKSYMEFPGAQSNWSLSQETGLGSFGDPTKMPTIGVPKAVKWRGREALSIEVDATKTMTKEAKLFYFFDPKSLDHIGISANLGSMTQVTEFKDLKVNRKIADSIFSFTPPKGWKRIKGV
jgi:outer membrane lipoprotein-sorting protein